VIHNFGDALTAVPLGIAFLLRSARGEKLAGLAVVLAILVSALVALYETSQRLIHRSICSICGSSGQPGWLASSATKWPLKCGYGACDV
jgi:divalent metal cation (Fe/Co/Zn/Cd) transporter